MICHEFLQGTAHGVGEPKDERQHSSEHQQAPEGMGGRAIQTLGEGYPARLRTLECGAGHTVNPLIAASGHSDDGVLMLSPDGLHLGPSLRWQCVFHHRRNLLICLEELESDPVHRVGFGHESLNDYVEAGQCLAMIIGDLWTVGLALGPMPEDLQSCVDELMHALVPCGGHGDDRHANGGSQDLGLYLKALLFGYVYHVESDDDGRGKSQKLGHQIEVALQRGGIDQHEHHIRSLVDDVISGDHFFGRRSGQTVGSGQVCDVNGHTIVFEGAGAPFHRLPRPVSDTLAEARQQVEHGALAHVGLARQSYGCDPVITHLSTLVPCMATDLVRRAAFPAHAHPAGLAAPKGDLGVQQGDDDGPVTMVANHLHGDARRKAQCGHSPHEPMAARQLYHSSYLPRCQIG